MDKLKKLPPRTKFLIFVAVVLIVCSIVFHPRSDTSESRNAAGAVSGIGSASDVALADEQPNDPEEQIDAVSPEEAEMESYADGTILLNKAEKRVADSPYFLTADECDDPRCSFPYEPPDAVTVDLTASCAAVFFPYETTYICSYNQMTIDGENLDFYEYYDDENLSLLCVIAVDNNNNYSLYNITDNTYTPIIFKS